MNVENNLSDRISGALKTRMAFSKHAQKKAFKEYASAVAADLRSLRTPLEELVSNNTGTKALLNKLQNDARAKDYFTYKTMLTSGPGSVDKRAASAEQEAPFSSLLAALNKYIDILTDVEASIDNIVTTDAVNLFNTRVSHVVAVGAIEEGKKLFKFINYMISSTVGAMTNQREVAKYRHAYIADNAAAVAALAVRSYSSASVMNFIGMIKELKTQAADAPLVDNTNGLSASRFNFAQVSSNTRSLLDIGGRFLSVFRWLGEMWENHKYTRAQEAKKLQEWIEAHITLLKLQLQDVDPNSDEYKRLVAIIEKYEDMVTTSDRKNAGPAEA